MPVDSLLVPLLLSDEAEIGSDLRLWELAPGLEPGTCCLQDSRESSRACWRVLSLQLRSVGSSSQRAPVGLSSGWWNDNRNDVVDLAGRLWVPESRSWVLSWEFVGEAIGPR